MSVNFSVEVMDQSTEGVAAALRRVKKVYLSQVSADVRRHEFYLKPGEQKRLKVKRARKKLRRQKHHFAYERLVYLDRLGLSDDKPDTRW